MPLTASQDHVIAQLAAGATITAAAQAAGIHRNTIALWRRTSPAFAQSLAEARYDRALHFRELAEEHAELAIATLHYLLADLDTPPGIRLKAALAILKECTTPPPPPPHPQNRPQRILPLRQRTEIQALLPLHHGRLTPRSTLMVSDVA